MLREPAPLRGIDRNRLSGYSVQMLEALELLTRDPDAEGVKALRGPIFPREIGPVIRYTVPVEIPNFYADEIDATGPEIRQARRWTFYCLGDGRMIPDTEIEFFVRDEHIVDGKPTPIAQQLVADRMGWE